jgi:chorismate mutase
MNTRGIRGAITVKEDTQEAILQATEELLSAMVRENPGLVTSDIASAFFTVTDDLRAAYPAQAARRLGWEEAPLMCGQEIAVPGGLPRCIRVLLLWNTEVKPTDIRHVYLREAVQLRPEWGMSNEEENLNDRRALK